jgi:hypothetical protein
VEVTSVEWSHYVFNASQIVEEKMMRRNAPLFPLMALAAGLLALSGCATIVNGTTEKVQLSSEPDGVQATVDGARIVTTPATVEMSRGDQHTITFHKDGYQDDTERLTSSESGWVWGNIPFGISGVLFAIADEKSGAAKKLSSNAVTVTLARIVPPANVAAKAAAVLDPVTSAPPAAAIPVSTALSGQTAVITKAAVPVSANPPASRIQQPDVSQPTIQ